LVESFHTSLKNKTVNYVDSKNAKLKLLEVTLNILNPDNVLKRGYTITSLNGKILKSKESIRKDDALETRFCDGTVSSKVITKET